MSPVAFPPDVAESFGHKLWGEERQAIQHPAQLSELAVSLVLVQETQLPNLGNIRNNAQ